jgi:hypothetical protein
MKPIILTEYNETLEEYGNAPIDDRYALSNCLGIHSHCGGTLITKIASNTHNVILCERCNLRVVVPNGLKTYGDLRRHINAILGR